MSVCECVSVCMCKCAVSLCMYLGVCLHLYMWLCVGADLLRVYECISVLHKTCACVRMCVCIYVYMCSAYVHRYMNLCSSVCVVE